MKRFLYLVAVMVALTLTACGGGSKFKGYTRSELFGSMPDSVVQCYQEISSVVFEDTENGNRLILGVEENAPVLSGKVYANSDREITAPDLVQIWYTGGKYYLLYCDGHDFSASSDANEKWANENLGPREK